MKRYEYRVEARPPGRDLASWLNEHAREGWRLIQVAPGTRDYLSGAESPLYYFEREAQEIETKQE